MKITRTFTDFEYEVVIRSLTAVRRVLEEDEQQIIDGIINGGWAIVPEVQVHKASPDINDQCQVCGLDVRKVPGGHGMTWVHTSTGTVAGSGA